MASEAACPLYQDADKACAWVSSCSVTDCTSKCVANMFDENKLTDRLDMMQGVALTCTALATTVNGAGMMSRRLQGTGSSSLKIPGALKAVLKPLATMQDARTARQLLNSATTDASCPTSSDIDAAAPSLAVFATLAEALLSAGEADMDAAEKASMEFLMSLMKDGDKMKDWLSSNCATGSVVGEELAVFWDSMDMGSTEMPATMTVCKPTDDSKMQLAMQIRQVMTSSACSTSAASISGASCIGFDATLMMQECMNGVSPILNLNSADVTTSMTSWKAVHDACTAITTSTECQAKAMDQEVQTAQAAVVNMDAAAMSTAVDLTAEVGAARAAVAGSFAAVAFAVLALVF